MDVIYKYEDNIEIIWNGFATFNVYDDGKNLICRKRVKKEKN